MKLFSELNLGPTTLKNRLLRAATFEGLADSDGFPQPEYKELYEKLARNEVGGIITGFTYISQQGKAMQPGQAGIDSDEKIPAYQEVTEVVHQHDCKIFMQLAHTGRQTQREYTGEEVVAPSAKKSFYFREQPRRLTAEEIAEIADDFAAAADRAQQAGFDGVQLHGAHGYLIHQFILPAVNKRNDQFGIDPELNIGTEFLQLVIERVRAKCGPTFPLLIKVSSGDDYWNSFSEKQFINLISYLDQQDLAGIEISYGTMDYALNIFRGAIPVDTILDVNPIYQIKNKWGRKLWKLFVRPLLSCKLKKFTPRYNLPAAKLVAEYTTTPIISVGGFRSGQGINQALTEIDAVSLSRPFLCEPDLAAKIKENLDYESQCCHCNLCAVMCDSQSATQCYQCNV